MYNSTSVQNILCIYSHALYRDTCPVGDVTYEFHVCVFGCITILDTPLFINHISLAS